MPDLEKILPLIIVALWYIFKGGKKKEQAAPENEHEEAVRKSTPSQARPKSKPKNNLQDILEELLNEANPEKIVRETFQTAQEEPSPSKYQRAEPPKPTKNDEEDLKAQLKRQEIIANFEKEQKLASEELYDEEAFDLKQAIIHQAILDRPYKD